MITARNLNLAIFVACLSLLGFGLYLEHGQGLEPCPLCVFQRIAYIAITIIALIAAIHDPQNIMRVIYNVLLILTALTGAGIAARQTWLQHLPPERVPACGPGLDYMLEVFPLGQALKMILSGSGECAEVQWTFIGLSIAEWSLACFSIITIVVLIATFKLRNR